MTNYKNFKLLDARLVILRALYEQTDWRLNQSLLLDVLDHLGHRHNKEWLRTQLRELEQLGVLKIHEVGEFMIGELVQLGKDHIERRVVVDGIKRPSPEE